MARTKSPRARWRRGRGGAPGLQQACRSWPFRILLPAGLQELAVLANNGKQKHAAGARCRRTPQAPGSGGAGFFHYVRHTIGQKFADARAQLGSSFQPRIRGSRNLEYSKIQMQTERGNQVRGHAEGWCEVL